MDVIVKKPTKITDEVSEEEVSFESHDDSSSENIQDHPFPTPPPDADADTKGKTEAKIAKKAGPKAVIIAMALAAIAFLKSRSGSSVPAIVKYIKSTGHEVTDDRRFSRAVLKQLKIAITKGEVTQVKRSFKLSEEMSKKSKSMEKMKETAVKKKLVNKQKAKAQSAETEQVDEGVKAKKVKKQTSEPKTTETAKIKKIDDQSAEEVKAKITKKQAPGPQTSQPVKGKKNGELNADQGEKAKKQKAKPARLSIGTLAQPNLKRKSIKKRTADKAAAGFKSRDDVDSDFNSEPTQASTPVAAIKQKGKGRNRKAQ